MATDPICHMEVDEATARSAERDGQTHYFCCERCCTTFLAEEGPKPCHEDAAPSHARAETVLTDSRRLLSDAVGELEMPSRPRL